MTLRILSGPRGFRGSPVTSNSFPPAASPGRAPRGTPTRRRGGRRRSRSSAARGRPTGPARRLAGPVSSSGRGRLGGTNPDAPGEFATEGFRRAALVPDADRDRTVEGTAGFDPQEDPRQESPSLQVT